METSQAKNSENLLSRRRFLGEASCSAVAGTSVLGSLLSLKLTAGLAASEEPAGDDYRALVCVYLQGGQDSYNMLVPRGESEYAGYASVRRSLALPQASLLPIEPLTNDGRDFGLHSSLDPVKQMFDDGELGFVANVGTLVEPTTKESFMGGLGNVPTGLFSHADQEQQWHTGLPDRSTVTGWAGRMSDLFESINGPDQFASAIALGAPSIMQTGAATLPYAITNTGSKELTDWKRNVWAHGRRAVTSQLELEYQNLLMQTYVDRKKQSIELNELFSTALETSGSPVVNFGADALSDQLEMVARTIAAREELGVRRQTFFVMLGGWDHHTELLAPHSSMLASLGQALSGFNTAIKGMGLSDSVTTFTASDFGRSLTSNGLGSDHGWGGNQLVLGGAVKGGDIYGDYPEIMRGGDLDVGRGRLIPTTSVDEYFAELACWFGVSRAQLPLVLPHLDRFYDVDSGSPPLGFMEVPA